MIKIVFCLRRLPTLSTGEFYRYWRESHARLVRQHAAALRIRRYTQGHTFTDPRIDAAVAARGCSEQPYDGVAEVYWDSIDDIVDVANTEEGLAAAMALLADERTFIDLPNSSVFYVREHVIVPE